MSRDIVITKRELVSTGRKTKVTPKNADLIMADCSSSMESMAIDGKSRIECVREALKPFNGRAHVLAFHTSVEEVDCDAIPTPRGSTNLTEALERALTLEPIHVLVMCDGGPNNPFSALETCAKLAQQCIVDCLYIGPPDSVEAINFMKELASVGHGRYSAFDLSVKSPLLLSQGVAAMLALPSPTGTIKL